MNEQHAEIAADIGRFAEEASTLHEDERRARYLALVKRAHPDGSGHDDLLRMLVDVYEQANARSTRAASVELAVRDILGDELTRLRRNERHVRRDDSKRVVEDIVRHHTSGLAQAKRQGRAASLAIAGIAALVALLRTLGLNTIEVTDAAGDANEVAWISPTVRVVLFSVLAVLSAVIALLAWRASARAAWMESTIEDAARTLGDKNSYLRALAEVRRGSSLGDTWNHDELRDAIDTWAQAEASVRPSRLRAYESARALLHGRALRHSVPLRELALVCGATDFASLLIAKGMELDLVLEERVSAPDGPQFIYRVGT